MNGSAELSHLSLALLQLGWRQVLFSTVVFTLVWTTTKTLGRRMPALHLALWSLVILRLLLPPGLAHRYAAGSLLVPLLPATVQAERPAGLGAEPSLADPGLPGGAVGLEQRIAWRGLAIPLLALLWLAGTAAVLGSTWRRWWSYRRIASSSAAVDDPRILRRMGEWQRRLRIRRAVRILAADDLTSPFATGSLRPCIVIPARLLLDPRPEVLDAVVAHELVHVARWDTVWMGLQQLVRSVYFFHPVAWAAGARIDEARERLVDATVLGFGTISPRAYAAGILATVKEGLAPVGAPALFARKRSLMLRLHTVLDSPAPTRPRTVTAAAAAIIVGVFVLPLATVASGPPAPPAPGPEPAVLPSPAAPEPPATPSEARPAAVPVAAVAPADAPRPEPAPAPAPPPAAPPARVAGALANPVRGGRTTAGFGEMRDPFNGETRHHDGLDLAAEAGTPVRAPAAGRVVTATDEYVGEAWGHVVILDHGDGLTTVFAHLGALLVTEGQLVRRGEVIAEVGNTGQSTGPHVHFEVRIDGTPVDPAPLLERRTVVVL